MYTYICKDYTHAPINIIFDPKITCAYCKHLEKYRKVWSHKIIMDFAGRTSYLLLPLLLLIIILFLTTPTTEHEAWHPHFRSHLMSYKDMLPRIITLWSESAHPTLRAENIHIYLAMGVTGCSSAPVEPTMYFSSHGSRQSKHMAGGPAAHGAEMGGLPGFLARGNLGNFVPAECKKKSFPTFWQQGLGTLEGPLLSPTQSAHFLYHSCQSMKPLMWHLWGSQILCD